MAGHAMQHAQQRGRDRPSCNASSKLFCPETLEQQPCHQLEAQHRCRWEEELCTFCSFDISFRAFKLRITLKDKPHNASSWPASLRPQLSSTPRASLRAQRISLCRRAGRTMQPASCSA